MKGNKHIERESRAATKIYDNRNLQTDYRTLQPILKKGMTVLDIGCGTGAISKDIAHLVGPEGKVIGIDNTEKFILSGQQTYQDVGNLTLLHKDIFEFEPTEKFDLIVAARVLQWLTTPQKALRKMKSWLRPNGQISILDYNHQDLDWAPAPPKSMQTFYGIFLKWRADAGMDNAIADHLAAMMTEVGLTNIKVLNSNEYYDRTRKDFIPKVGIWSKVAGLQQLVEEGYLDEALKQQAIEEYDHWVATEAVSMTMKLNEVRGRNRSIPFR